MFLKKSKNVKKSNYYKFDIKNQIINLMCLF